MMTNSGSIWVAWARRYFFKGYSIWVIRMPTNAPWSWRKILELRERAAPHVKWQVGTGYNIYFWFDNWIGLGYLAALCHRGWACFPSLGLHATVTDVLRDGSWTWPRTNDIQAEEIAAHVLANVTLSARDHILWGGRPSFSIARAYLDLSPQRQRFIWHHLIWFQGNLPRASFIYWLAILDKLSKSWIQNWLNISNINCEFCGEAEETRSHMFFSCRFTAIT